MRSKLAMIPLIPLQFVRSAIMSWIDIVLRSAHTFVVRGGNHLAMPMTLSLDSLRVDLIRLHIFSGGETSAFHFVAGS
jgi:hypothetical protein